MELIIMGTKEIAKLIRKDLKEMKGFKFSVRCEFFSMGSSIDVSIMESPIRLIRNMSEIPEDIDMQHYTRSDIERMQGKNYHQLNHIRDNREYDENVWNNGVFLTHDGFKAVNKVIDIINKYHINRSDSQTDYFDVNFYYDLNLGKWNKDFIDGE